MKTKNSSITLELEQDEKITDVQHALIQILEQLNLDLESPFELHNKQKIIHSYYWLTKLLKATLEKQQ